ncbi:MAG: NAD(P)-dependent oxidoreductase [Thermoanaerobaculia bacterium]|nr:MAG: NAD(P)-dependent oxidoreductase [Thermoanaerobaculia bacterium]MBZ0101691.1 NAD(P)-dependent oxidoreductase [Thermoanaerobaculia bacterium]
MRGLRCLVTGATGFLGGHLLAELASEGAEVAVLSRVPQPAGLQVARWYLGDLEDSAAVEAALADDRPEVVFHLASFVTGRRELDLVLPTFRANLSSSVHLLAAATRAGCRRIVLAGSMEEPEPGVAPPSPYAAAKAASSLYAAFFHAAYGAPVVTARIFMTYGPGQRDRAKVIPASILAALGGHPPHISSGARPVDWIYAGDVARGLVALAVAPDLEGATLDLGSGELVTVREVVERICRATGAPPPVVGALPDRPLEAVRRADVAATFARCGWRPQVDLDSGLARTIDFYRDEAGRKG